MRVMKTYNQFLNESVFPTRGTTFVIDGAEILNEDYKEDGIYLEVGISKDDIYLVENYVI